MNTPEGIDRRRYVRQRIASLAYVELGKDNGGIALNLSEGGMAVAAATPMAGGAIPRIRFRLPGSPAWIEAGAEIAWIADSNKEAGISFVDLPERDRTRIREWISSPVSAIPAAPASDAVVRPRVASSLDAPAAKLLEPEPVPESPDTPGSPKPVGPSVAVENVAAGQPPAPATAAPAPAASATTASPIASPAPAVPAPQETPRGTASRGTPLFGASVLGSKEVYVEYPGKSRKDTAIRIEFRVSRWMATAVVVVLVALASFVGGMAAARGSWSGLLARFTSSGGATESSDRAASEPQNPSSDPGVLAPDSQGASSRSHAQPDSLPPDSGAPNLPARSLSASPARGAIENSSSPQPAPAVGPSTAASEGLASVLNPPRGQSQSNPSASVSSSSVQAERDLSGSLANQPHNPSDVAPFPPSAPAPAEVPAPPAAVAAPVPAPAPAPNAVGTVEVVTTPYPSIRVPPALQGSQSEALRIGALVTRVDPVYPPEALRQGIQGVVQLHILIGSDGSVMDMQVVRGPELLLAATRDAVGRWRYQPTLLGTEAVQTEADVTVSFKLGSPAPK